MPVEPQSGWWWLSFVDPDRPEGDRFLGACIVEGTDLGAAVQTAWMLGCNPGGEVAGIGIVEGRVPAEEYRDRLLPKAEALELNAAIEERWGRGKRR